MKRMLLGALVLLICLLAASVAHAAEPSTSTPQTLGPGDKGYKHDEFHEHYQKLFKDGDCYCRTGQCRPTIYRIDPTSPSRIEVKIDGGWYDVPVKALRTKQSVPPELWHESAHVCAYPRPTGGYEIECAIINSGV